MRRPASPLNRIGRKKSIKVIWLRGSGSAAAEYFAEKFFDQGICSPIAGAIKSTSTRWSAFNRDRLFNVRNDRLEGGFEVVMGSNHHMAKPVRIGEVQADGQFSIVYSSKALPPKAWSPYVEANKGKVPGWSWPWVCGGCTSPPAAEPLAR
jgi:hypothetical protein